MPPAVSNGLNVLGSELEECSRDPLTGFYRDGCCDTGDEDIGRHTVCARMTETFLDFSVSHGNDLITPRPEYRFPGLKPGDLWCVCVLRWREAYEAGVAPPVYLRGTHQHALHFVTLEQLKTHALDSEFLN